MVTFNLTFSDEEAGRIFTRHGFKVEKKEFTRHVPVYHNKIEAEKFTCMCVIHPHTGAATPLGVAFERVFKDQKERLFISEIDKLTALKALNTKKKNGTY